MKDRRAEPRESAAWALAGVGVALGWLTLVPVMRGTWFQSHESVTYPVRLVEYVEGWRSGQLYPRWCPDYLGGYGYPFFNFYAPGLFTVSGLGVLAGLGITAGLKAALVLFTACGAVGMFGLAHGETGRRDAALLSTVIFLAAPYRFVDLMIRGDLAEYSAMCLLPCVLWGYRSLGRVSRERFVPAAASTALLHGALVLTHAIIGQWGSQLIAIIALADGIALWRRGERARAVASGAVIALGLGVAAVYWVPALHDRQYVQLERIITDYFRTETHAVEAWRFIRFDYFEPVVDEQLGSPRRMPFTVGEPIALGMLVAAVVWIVRWARARGTPAVASASTRPLPLWWALTAGVLFLMTPTGTHLYPLLPFSAYLQFPWRLLTLVSVSGSVVAAIVWERLVKERKWRWPLATVLGLAISAGTLRFAWVDREFGREDVPTTPAAVRETTVATADEFEYLPAGLHRIPGRVRSVVAAPAAGYVSSFDVQPHDGRYLLRLVTPAAAAVDVYSFFFPGWRIATVSGPTPARLQASPQGFIRATFPTPGSYRAEVYFGATPIRTAGAAMSLLSLLLLAPATLWLKRLVPGSAGSSSSPRAR